MKLDLCNKRFIFRNFGEITYEKYNLILMLKIGKKHVYDAVSDHNIYNPNIDKNTAFLLLFSKLKNSGTK